MGKRDELELKRADIFRGRQRKLAFLELKNTGLMVSEIRREVNNKITEESEKIRLRDVSRALQWLENEGYAICLNPKDRRKPGKTGIMYKLSRKGKEIRNII